MKFMLGEIVVLRYFCPIISAGETELIGGKIK